MSDGLARERTRLAWVRTGAILATIALGVGGTGLRGGGGPVGAVLLGLGALAGAVLLARTGLRDLRVRQAVAEGLPLDHRTDALIAWLGTLAVVGGSAAFLLR
ncbi:DUF202 domain-containing protein [Acrocarpospora catenulata]|uniref:DUF202 domain-containing protein n=1 Tax=Acrocarpospora catenulata TaxID=2836182 RepID=UPI001BDB02EE|nr:DUF202 domain-containing protein [Acrocarpospora catenulata]